MFDEDHYMIYSTNKFFVVMLSTTVICLYQPTWLASENMHSIQTGQMQNRTSWKLLSQTAAAVMVLFIEYPASFMKQAGVMLPFVMFNELQRTFMTFAGKSTLASFITISIT